MKILIAVASLALIAACTSAPGDYPSLAPRAVEQLRDAHETEAAPPAPAADAATTARVAAILAEARSGEAAFVGALPAAERAISTARGSAAASEPWIVAQQQLSALDTARTPTATAMTALDSLYLELAQGSGGGLPEAEVARAEIEPLYNRQIAKLAALQQVLSQP